MKKDEQIKEISTIREFLFLSMIFNMFTGGDTSRRVSRVPVSDTVPFMSMLLGSDVE